MSLEDNLKDFTLINGKNKVATYGNYYYHVMMVKNTEYSNRRMPFLTLGTRNYYMNGVEPIISIYNGSSIIKQYTFRNEIGKIYEPSNPGTNIHVQIPYPNNNLTDTQTGLLNCQSYDPITINNVVIQKKPHVADMQILVTGTKLHVFMLVDIISIFYPSDFTQQNLTEGTNVIGHWGRSVIYQQHELTDAGATLTILPSMCTHLPMNYSSSDGGTVKYGKFLDTYINVASKNYSIKTYYSDEYITDFHCGIIDSTHIYCLLGKLGGTMHIFSASTTYTDDKEWGYNGLYPKFKEFKVLPTTYNPPFPYFSPFNVYSYYKDSANFYISCSYYDHRTNLIKWIKVKCTKFTWNKEWRFDGSTVVEGNGLIVYDDDMNFIWDGKYKRIEGTTSNDWDTLVQNFVIDKSILNLKYKLSIDNETPKLGLFNFLSISLLNTFFSKFDFSGNLLPDAFLGKIDYLNLLNPIQLPLILSITKYYDPNYIAFYYNYFGCISKNVQIRSKLIKKGTEYKVSSFENISKYQTLPNSGNYYLSWDLT